MRWTLIAERVVPQHARGTSASPASSLLRSRPRVSTLVALALAGAVAVPGVHYGVPDRPFDGLDSEGNAAAWLSAALLAGAAALMLLHAHAVQRRAPAVLGALMAFLAVDELETVHEALEHQTGVDWQLLYAPLALVALTAGLLTFAELRPGPRLLLLLAGAAWTIAQGLEALQWQDDALVHAWMILPEELLEMAGSALIVVALLREGESRRRR